VHKGMVVKTKGNEAGGDGSAKRKEKEQLQSSGKGGDKWREAGSLKRSLPVYRLYRKKKGKVGEEKMGPIEGKGGGVEAKPQRAQLKSGAHRKEVAALSLKRPQKKGNGGEGGRKRGKNAPRGGAPGHIYGNEAANAKSALGIY